MYKNPHLNESHCSLCGSAGPFAPLFPGASLRESRCHGCRAPRRTRDVARVLLALCALEEHAALRGCHHLLQDKAIFELQAAGALHEALKGLPGYVCSEFLPATKPGCRDNMGILCQDATALTFVDASFDLVISQDVLEHISDAPAAFREINRVLRPGGSHVFSVPVHEGHLTRQRARQEAKGPRHLLPPVWHKDPLNPQGALVFWDFGDDLPVWLGALGLKAEAALRAAFYPTCELCRIDDGPSYQAYQKTVADAGPAAFFLYNSLVFVATKA